MFANKFRTGIAVTALVASGLAIGAPALADPPSNTTPSTTDLVGVGSDTTQIAMNYGAAAYNAAVGSGVPQMYSWDACVQSGSTCTPGTTANPITLRSGSTPIVRPNGSGTGKGLLYGSNDNPDVTFARSSAGLSQAEGDAGLKAYPFAVDTLVTVVSSSVTSHAPAALSIGQILGIYNGTFTNWSQLGGSPGVIKPLLPQSGSGTRNFFIAQLTNANNGVAPTLAPSVTDAGVQEHDPTLIKNDPDAIAPFSLGRIDSTVRQEFGWQAQRAVYNVVRSQNATGHTDNSAWFAGATLIENAFGPSGLFCTNSSVRQAVLDHGLKPMTTQGAGGACGVSTSSSTSNFANISPDTQPTQSSLSTAVSPAVRGYGSASNLVVNVTNGGTGFVSVYGRGFTGVARVSGAQAIVPIPSTLPAGSYPITANYSGDQTHLGSAGTATLVVTRAAGSISGVTVKPAKAKKHKKATTYVATVRVAAAGVTPTGAVVVKKGSRVVGVGSLRNGVATVSIKIAKLKKGKNKLTVSYAGDGNVTNAVKTIVVKRKK